MAYILEFPITLRDAGTGAERAPTAEEIAFGADDEERIDDKFSLTEYPRDKLEENGTAIWFGDGTVPGTKSIYVAKMYPNWCPSSMPLCHPTNPILPEWAYRGNVTWRADTSYSTSFDFYLNTDGTVS